MGADGNQTKLSEASREREQSRERKAAAWILILSMAISAIVAMVLTALLQRR